MISLESTRPGVSKNTNCVLSTLRTARTLDFVVWTLQEYGHTWKTQSRIGISFKGSKILNYVFKSPRASLLRYRPSHRVPTSRWRIEFMSVLLPAFGTPIMATFNSRCCARSSSSFWPLSWRRHSSGIEVKLRFVNAVWPRYDIDATGLEKTTERKTVIRHLAILSGAIETRRASESGVRFWRCAFKRMRSFGRLRRPRLSPSLMHDYRRLEKSLTKYLV